MYLEVKTPASTTPVTLTQAKAQLRVTWADEDVHIASLIRHATAVTELIQRRSLINRTYTLYLDDFEDEIGLPMPPLSSVTTIKYYDSDSVQQTIAAAEYQVVKHDTVPYVTPAVDGAWPDTDSRKNAIEIEYVAGYGATEASTPPDTEAGLLMLISDGFEHRESEIVGVMVMSMHRTAKSLIRLNKVPRLS